MLVSWSKRHRGACFDVKDEAFQEKDGNMDEPRSVKDGGEDINQRVMTSHTEMCEQSVEGCEVFSVEEGHDVDQVFGCVLSTSFGSLTCSSWMCKKETSVSHSSTESEIISLDAGLRMDGNLHLICGI